MNVLQKKRLARKIVKYYFCKHGSTAFRQSTTPRKTHAFLTIRTLIQENVYAQSLVKLKVCVHVLQKHIVKHVVFAQ